MHRKLGQSLIFALLALALLSCVIVLQGAAPFKQPAAADGTRSPLARVESTPAGLTGTPATAEPTPAGPTDTSGAAEPAPTGPADTPTPAEPTSTAPAGTPAPVEPAPVQPTDTPAAARPTPSRRGNAPAAVQPAPAGSSDAPAAAEPAGIYVAADGNDSTGNGTKAKPYATIQKAVSLAGAGSSIVLRGGTYYQEVILNRAGSPGNPITIMAYPGETPIIDGSLPQSRWVGGWINVGGTVYKRQFTHYVGLNADEWGTDVSPMSSAPNGYSGSGDPMGFVSVDGIPDQGHWLQPVTLPNNPGTIAQGAWASDVVPPPGNPHHSGDTNWVYVNLGHLPDPNPANHTITIAGWNNGILLGRKAAYIRITGLTFQYSLEQLTVDAFEPHNFEVDHNVFRWAKGRNVVSYVGNEAWWVHNNTFYQNEYAAIHMEANNSVVENNTITETIAPWSIWGSGGILVAGDNVVVRNNTISGMRASRMPGRNGRGGHGIYIEQWTNVQGHKNPPGPAEDHDHMVTAKNVLVQGNRISDCEGTGIYNAGADGGTYQDNVINNCGQDGIAMLIAGTDSQGYPPSNPGAWQTADSNVVYHNTVSGCGGKGINVSRAATNTTLKDNMAYQNSGGDYVQDGSGTMVNDNFTGVHQGRIRRIDGAEA